MTAFLNKKYMVTVTPEVAEIMRFIWIGDTSELAIPLPFTTALGHQIGRAVADLLFNVYVIEPSEGRSTSVIKTKKGGTIGVTAQRPADGEIFWTWQVRAANPKGRGNIDLLNSVVKRVQADYAQAGLDRRQWTDQDGVIHFGDYKSQPTNISEECAIRGAYTKHVVLRLLNAQRPIKIVGGKADDVRAAVLFGFRAEAKFLETGAPHINS